jgi:hypothetical protein
MLLHGRIEARSPKTEDYTESKNRGGHASVLDCGSRLPLLYIAVHAKAAEGCRSPKSREINLCRIHYCHTGSGWKKFATLLPGH